MRKKINQPEARPLTPTAVKVWFVAKAGLRPPRLRASSIQAGEKPQNEAPKAGLTKRQLSFCLATWMKTLLSPYYLFYTFKPISNGKIT